jgi:hypothetical protein
MKYPSALKNKLSAAKGYALSIQMVNELHNASCYLKE